MKYHALKAYNLNVSNVFRTKKWRNKKLSQVFLYLRTINKVSNLDMKLNEPFIRNFSDNHLRMITLYSFFMYRYSIEEDRETKINSFLNFFAANMKNVVVGYDSLDKCYKEWIQYGVNEIVEVSSGDIENFVSRISDFLGLSEIEPLNEGYRKTLYSFLESNDGGLFYVYINNIDLFYNFLYFWRDCDVKEFARTANISKRDIRFFNLFSDLIFSSGGFLKKSLVNLLGQDINKFLKNVIKLYSSNGFEFDANSVKEKAYIMTVLGFMNDYIEQFMNSIEIVMLALNNNNIKTTAQFDNYLLLYMYQDLAKRALEKNKEYGYNDNIIRTESTCDTTEKRFLPKNYFELPSVDKNEYFGEIREEIEDVDAFEDFINYLASDGYIKDDDLTKRMIAFVLTGKGKPEENVFKIEWKKGRNELAYMCQKIYAFKGKMQRIPLFFNYENMNNKLTSNYADNASVKFKDKMKLYFPGL